MASLNFSNREIRDVMRDMNISDTQRDVKEAVSDTLDDIKELSKKGKSKVEEYSVDFLKTVGEYKLGDKSKDALIKAQETSSQYSEVVKQKMEELKVREKFGEMGSSILTSISSWSSRSTTSQPAPALNSDDNAQASDSAAEEANMQQGDRKETEKPTGVDSDTATSTTSTISTIPAPTPTPAHTENPPAEVQPGSESKQEPQMEDGASADETKDRVADSATEQEGSSRSTASVTDKLMESFKGFTSYVRSIDPGSLTAAAVGSSQSGPSSSTSSSAGGGGLAGDPARVTTSAPSSSWSSELRDLQSFLHSDFQHFAADLEDSVTSTGIRLYAGGPYKTVPASGIARFVGSIESQWASIDEHLSTNDVKMQVANETLRRLVVAWMKNRSQLEEYEAELHQLPSVCETIKTVTQQVGEVMESIGQLEAALVEAEENRHEHAAELQRREVERKYQDREDSHRAQIEAWESTRESWASDAAQNRKNWNASQESAVADLEAQLMREALALQGKATTTDRSTYAGYGTISDVSLSLSEVDNRLVSQTELDSFYQDTPQDSDELKDKSSSRRHKRSTRHKDAKQ